MGGPRRDLFLRNPVREAQAHWHYEEWRDSETISREFHGTSMHQSLAGKKAFSERKNGVTQWRRSPGRKERNPVRQAAKRGRMA